MTWLSRGWHSPGVALALLAPGAPQPCRGGHREPPAAPAPRGDPQLAAGSVLPTPWQDAGLVPASHCSAGMLPVIICILVK